MEIQFNKSRVSRLHKMARADHVQARIRFSAQVRSRRKKVQSRKVSGKRRLLEMRG